METINLFDSVNDILNDNTCTICYDNMNESDFYEMKDCKHKFHYKCIIEWIFQSQTCPLCRHSTEKKPATFLLKSVLNFMRSKKNKSKKLKNIYNLYKKDRVMCYSPK
jgi:hypothetical protein